VKTQNTQIVVYNWNTNGTNDIEILVDGEVVDSMPEALFGLNIGNVDAKVVSLKQCLKHIAVSPVSDGSSTLKFLRQYI
jgi:hypothetical protein